MPRILAFVFWLERSQTMLERDFQAELIKTIRALLPGCEILKNDSSYLQGVPDLLVLYGDRWAMLEVKKSLDEPYQPNQEYYIERFDTMSYATMICPENRELKLDELQSTLRAGRASRLSLGQ